MKFIDSLKDAGQAVAKQTRRFTQRQMARLQQRYRAALRRAQLQKLREGLKPFPRPIQDSTGTGLPRQGERKYLQEQRRQFAAQLKKTDLNRAQRRAIAFEVKLAR
jgi:hypothetical protein